MYFYTLMILLTAPNRRFSTSGYHSTHMCAFWWGVRKRPMNRLFGGVRRVFLASVAFLGWVLLNAVRHVHFQS